MTKTKKTLLEERFIVQERWLDSGDKTLSNLGWALGRADLYNTRKVHDIFEDLWVRTLETPYLNIVLQGREKVEYLWCNHHAGHFLMCLGDALKEADFITAWNIRLMFETDWDMAVHRFNEHFNYIELDSPDKV